MKMSERRAAASLRIKALAAAVEAPVLPAHVTYLGMRNGKPHYRVIPVMEPKPRAATTLARWAESKAEQHRVGDACPHCSGTGRYHFHTNKTRNERCFRCNGKGRLDAKDLGFLNKRLGGTGPVCWVVSATAA